MRETDRNRKRIGKQGEMAARAYLEHLGWEIVAANYRCIHGEMDLIAREINGAQITLVFVEVKTRRGSRHGMPGEAVDARKQGRLIAIAQAFLAEKQGGGDEPAYRFDVVEVVTGPDGLMTVHRYPAAFTAD